MMYVCYPGDDVATAISMTNEDLIYKAEHALNDDPSTSGISMPAKSTTDSTTFTITTSAAAQAVFLFNTSNLGAATVTVNGNAMTMNLQDLDGHRNNPWIDLRTILPTTPITIAITGGTGNVAVGRIFVTGTLRELGARIGTKFKTSRPTMAHSTLKGKPFVYDKGVRNREVELSVITDTDRQIMQSMWYSAKGRVLPWVLVPWHDRNDALWVRFTTDELPWTETEGLGIEEGTFTAEQWMGLAL